MPKKPPLSDALAELSNALAIVNRLGPNLQKMYLAFVDAKPVTRDEEAHATWVEALARFVDGLESHFDVVKEIRAAAGESLCRAVPRGTTLISYEGVRAMTPRWGGDRKGWRNDLLEADVKPRLLMEGEIKEVEGKFVWESTGEKRSPDDVLDMTLSVVSLNGNNCKTTGLRKLGLDPDAYCHKTPIPPDVQITK